MLGSYFHVVGISYDEAHFTYISLTLSEFKNILKYLKKVFQQGSESRTSMIGK